VAFVCGVGTGGTITGVGRFLKARLPGVRIVLADPVGARLAHLVDSIHPDHDAGYLVEGIGGSERPAVVAERGCPGPVVAVLADSWDRYFSRPWLAAGG
jgi:cysteine synthase